ncbi:MAG: hypothetical protein ACRDVW_10135 [Acidimicrobiales bacterium]
MRRGDRFPDDQAEVVFSDIFVEQLEADLSETDRIDVLAEVVALCKAPGGKHPLKAPLAGWNTLDVLAARRRVVYKACVVEGTGLIEVLCLGPRRDSEVYDMASGVAGTGLLSEEELTQLWDALAILDVAAQSVGLEGWDYRSPPAPEGLRRSVVAAGVLDVATAALLSQDELLAAMEHAWDEGRLDPAVALVAALERARGSADFGERAILSVRQEERCAADMHRARATCIRRRGHPGPHRARP